MVVLLYVVVGVVLLIGFGKMVELGRFGGEMYVLISCIG